MQDDFGERAAARRHRRTGSVSSPGCSAPRRHRGRRDGAARSSSAQVAGASRFGIPAIAHEECLTGFVTSAATVFPYPAGLGRHLRPGLVREMAAAIGAACGGSASTRAWRRCSTWYATTAWGRTEETIGEDPYLVGIGTAYVRGLEGAGIVATLKHFAGYSASRGRPEHGPGRHRGRASSPTSSWPPFETGTARGRRPLGDARLRRRGRRPRRRRRRLLTGLLGTNSASTGVVVADYYAISFLETCTRVAGSRGEAGALALHAGVDVELPTARCYGEPLSGSCGRERARGARRPGRGHGS